mgnify:CR=1 FL=1
MKFLNSINGSAKKFVKGMFVMFLFIIIGVFITQSCQIENEELEDNLSKQIALTKYESLVREITPTIQRLVENQQNQINSKINLSEETKKTFETEMNMSLQPLVEGTKELLVPYDINNEELREDFTDLNDPRIVLIGLFILAAESEESNETAMDFANAFIPSAHASPPSTEIQCAVEAIGLDVIYSVATLGFKKAAKKGIKKAIRKIATKFLGPVGVGIAVAEFAWCMYINS